MVDGNDDDDDDSIEFPDAAEVPVTYKETSAFQAVGPIMKEYLGILERAEEKETKIQALVKVVSDLLSEERKNQLKNVNEATRRQSYVSCSVPHDKRRKVEVTRKGRDSKKLKNPYRKSKEI